MLTLLHRFHFEYLKIFTAKLQRKIEFRTVKFDLRTFSSSEALSRAAAEAFAQLARKAISEKGQFAAVLTGGVFQNDLLLSALRDALPAGVTLWTNRIVPPNDGGISLGQAALGAFAHRA